MGWARTLLLGDIGNRLDIGDAEEDIAALRRTLKKKANTDRSQDARLEDLEQENDTLKLCVATLGRLLVGMGILTIQDLSGFAELIDETSG